MAIAQQCECTQRHRTVHLKMVETVNVILCIFYHIKKKKNKKRYDDMGILGAALLTSRPAVIMRLTCESWELLPLRSRVTSV